MTQFQDFVQCIGQKRAIAQGEHAFCQGEHDSRVYLVKSGLFKAYYLRPDGKEHIKSFLPEGSIIGSMVALIDGDPCTFSLAALEDSAVVSLPYARLKEAAAGDIALANTLVDFLAGYGKKKERREYELLSLTPEERYAQLLKTIPEVAERVSQADMAAYIGITPQALSRIRRRMGKLAA